MKVCNLFFLNTFNFSQKANVLFSMIVVIFGFVFCRLYFLNILIKISNNSYMIQFVFTTYKHLKFRLELRDKVTHRNNSVALQQYCYLNSKLL